MKYIVLLGLLVITINAYYTFISFAEKNTIVICNEKSGMTLVVKPRSQHPILATVASSKDMLSCLGKSIPYYSRNLAGLLPYDTSKHTLLQERYIIQEEKVARGRIEIDFFDNLYLIRADGTLIIVGSKHNISPFTVAKYISSADSIIVYMPENSAKIDEITRKMVEDKGGQFYTLKIGEKVVDSLFRRS